MSDLILSILGILFVFCLFFGGGILDFLETRRMQKYKHEQEMARLRNCGPNTRWYEKSNEDPK